MAIRLEGRIRPYCPKDTDEVRCLVHGIVTTWGVMGELQREALEAGLDVGPEMQCLLAPASDEA